MPRQTAKAAPAKDKGKKFDRFQVEMERLGKKYSVEIDVMDVRSGRGRRDIVSRGVFKDAQNWIELKTRGAPTYKKTIPLTLDCIDKRGFVPRAYRLWTGDKWGEWTDVAGYPKPR